MSDIIIFALGTLFGMVLLIEASAVIIQFSVRKDAVKENDCPLDFHANEDKPIG